MAGLHQELHPHYGGTEDGGSLGLSHGDLFPPVHHHSLGVVGSVTGPANPHGLGSARFSRTAVDHVADSGHGHGPSPLDGLLPVRDLSLLAATPGWLSYLIHGIHRHLSHSPWQRNHMEGPTVQEILESLLERRSLANERPWLEALLLIRPRVPGPLPDTEASIVCQGCGRKIPLVGIHIKDKVSCKECGRIHWITEKLLVSQSETKPTPWRKTGARLVGLTILGLCLLAVAPMASSAGEVLLSSGSLYLLGLSALWIAILLRFINTNGCHAWIVFS